MGFYRLEEFDRTRNFIAVGELICHGKKFESGQPFDKTLVDTRRLKQLYQQHKIRHGEQHDQVVAGDLTFDQVIKDLKDITRTDGGETGLELLPPPPAVATIELSDARKAMRAIDIPADWEKLPWMKPVEENGLTLRGLGAKFKDNIGRPILNKDDAIESVRTELMLREKGA